jgi:hypothetical protein
VRTGVWFAVLPLPDGGELILARQSLLEGGGEFVQSDEFVVVPAGELQRGGEVLSLDGVEFGVEL